MTEVIDILDKQKNILKIRHTNLHTEERADRKIMIIFILKDIRKINKKKR